MADMQARIAISRGVLLAHGWQSGLIGTVMPIRGIIAAYLIGK